MWRCLSTLHSLRDLYLGMFTMADIPAEVLLLTKLTRLCFLDGLENMSRDLSPLKNLVELGLSSSMFGSIPAMLSTCRSLTALRLYGGCYNLLIDSEGTDTLKRLPRLQQLYLDGPNESWSKRSLPGVVYLARALPLLNLVFN